MSKDKSDKQQSSHDNSQIKDEDSVALKRQDSLIDPMDDSLVIPMKSIEITTINIGSIGAVGNVIVGNDNRIGEYESTTIASHFARPKPADDGDYSDDSE